MSKKERGRRRKQGEGRGDRKEEEGRGGERRERTEDERVRYIIHSTLCHESHCNKINLKSQH